MSTAVHDSANRNVFRYTGRESTWSNNAKPTGDWANSVTDVYHYRSREYLPAIGQFNRLDDYRPEAMTAGFAGGLAAMQNPNLFGYVEGNPVMWGDPFGLEPVSITAIVIGGIVSFVAGVGVGIVLHEYAKARSPSGWKSCGDNCWYYTVPGGDGKTPHVTIYHFGPFPPHTPFDPSQLDDSDTSPGFDHDLNPHYVP